jgi:hypothetical protein
LVEIAGDATLALERDSLAAEADELKRIFSAIAGKDDTTGSL